MDGKVAVDITTLAISIPLWSVVSGSIALISFGAGIAILAINVRNSVKSNIVQNNLNHETQMTALAQQNELLRKIICLTRLQLTAIGDPKFKYRRQCEDDFA